jgi:CRP/FNR family transcriptional regulator, cyclic AMP receptor protein
VGDIGEGQSRPRLVILPILQKNLLDQPGEPIRISHKIIVDATTPTSGASHCSSVGGSTNGLSVVGAGNHSTDDTNHVARFIIGQASQIRTAQKDRLSMLVFRPLKSRRGTRELDQARKVKGPSFDANPLLATAGRGRTKLEYRSEEVVFSQGDAADSIFYVLTGKIKIVVTSKQGREAVVAVLGEGDFFGEGCLVGQPLRLATAASMTDAAVMRVEKAEMLRLLHAEPDFAEVFTVHLLTRKSRVEADLADHLFNQVKSDWPATFCCWRIFGEGRPEPIIAKIT